MPSKICKQTGLRYDNCNAFDIFFKKYLDQISPKDSNKKMTTLRKQARKIFGQLSAAKKEQLCPQLLRKRCNSKSDSINKAYKRATYYHKLMSVPDAGAPFGYSDHLKKESAFFLNALKKQSQGQSKRKKRTTKKRQRHLSSSDSDSTTSSSSDESTTRSSSRRRRRSNPPKTPERISSDIENEYTPYGQRRRNSPSPEPLYFNSPPPTPEIDTYY